MHFLRSRFGLEKRAKLQHGTIRPMLLPIKTSSDSCSGKGVEVIGVQPQVAILEFAIR